MLITPYINAVIHHCKVSEGWTVNVVHKRKFLEYHLCPAVQWKHAHFITDAPVLVLYDNTPCHVARPVTDPLAWWRWETLEYPPYPLDMSPCAFDLFLKMKELLRGKQFGCILVEAMWTTGQTITDINKNWSADGIHLLPEIWNKVHCMADYTDGMPW
jgi:hypothetical protein